MARGKPFTLSSIAFDTTQEAKNFFKVMLQKYIPGARVSFGLSQILFHFGVILVLCSVILVVLAVGELSKAKTAFDVRKPTINLVTTGIFGYSSNPTYLSLVMICFGFAFLVNSLAMFLASIMVGSVLCLLVIRNEETYLQQKFKAQYFLYSQSVRRWI